MGCGASHVAEPANAPNATSKTNDNTNTSNSAQKQSQLTNDSQDSPPVSTNHVAISDGNDKTRGENQCEDPAETNQSEEHKVCPCCIFY